MNALVSDIDSVPDRIGSRQKEKILLKDKKNPNKPEVSLENISSLWTMIQEDVLKANNKRATVKATFDSPEDAERIGLQIDAMASGSVGVGINGSTVYFWRRDAS